MGRPPKGVIVDEELVSIEFEGRGVSGTAQSLSDVLFLPHITI